MSCSPTPPSLLEPGRWLSQGLSAILASRMDALGSNISTLVVVAGSIVLGPFMLVGAWQKRREPLVAGITAYLVLLLAVMTVAFPFSGPRGGLFHSAAGVLPILWALTPIGVARVLEWVSVRRAWSPERAWRLFTPAILVLVISLSVWVAWDRVVAGWPSAPRWEASDRQHQAVADALLHLDPSPGIVAVNDPPGFHLASGVPCVVVPYGDASTFRMVADRFDLEWVILDANYPAPLAAVYQDPESVPWLDAQGTGGRRAGQAHLPASGDVAGRGRDAMTERTERLPRVGMPAGTRGSRRWPVCLDRVQDDRPRIPSG